MATKPQTTANKKLSGQAVHSGLHQLLQQAWQDLRQASAHFRKHHQDDPEALHDLRVAMRRLRSLYQAFAPAINPRDPRPAKLREIFRRTNPLRDLEVALARLNSLPTRLDWLEEEWQQQLDAYSAGLQDLPSAIQALDAAPDTPPQPDQQRLGRLAAKRLRKQAKRLKGQLKQVNKHWRDSDVHRLRIRIKKIRYLLEPFMGECRPCARTVKQLKRLQDQIGEHRDLQLLMQTLKQLAQGCNNPAQHEQLNQAIQQLKARSAAQTKALKRALRKPPLSRLRKAIKALK